MWERACSRSRRCGFSDAPQRSHREQARSHTTSVFSRVSGRFDGLFFAFRLTQSHMHFKNKQMNKYDL
ncbi:hypothetical protein F7Q95_22155 [Pseudomonas psychrophila]|nr:hypothetical protein F7Q95_22155 [Pseudomonas psychrophila]